MKTYLSYLFATLVAAVLLVPSTPALAAPPCSLPNRVHVQTVPVIDRPSYRVRLLSTITVAASDEITSITFGTLRNASVAVAGQVMTSGQTLTLPAGTTAVELVVERVAPGQAVMVPFVVHDTCGAWPSFVGGGSGAF